MLKGKFLLLRPCAQCFLYINCISMTGLEQQLTQSWPMESILKYMKKGIIENQRQVKDALEKKDKYFLENNLMERFI